MASIWIAHAMGSTRPLAIKILGAHASETELMMMFLDELAVATRLKHPNIVESIEVVSTDEELGLVMEYVEGETLSRATKAAREQGGQVPIAIAARIVTGALACLHAAHEATDDHGRPLGLVHRDVSPQNIVVGVDGVPRILDFGVVKAAGRLQQTRSGQLKGKVAYMAPEQLDKGEVRRTTDIYAMGIVLWETLTGRRCFVADNEGHLVRLVLQGVTDSPRVHRPDIPASLEAVIMRALSASPEDRYPTARHMAGAIELATPLAATTEVAEWLQQVAARTLEVRARRIAKMLGRDPSAASDPPEHPSHAPGAASSGSLKDISSRPLITSSSSSQMIAASPASSRPNLRASESSRLRTTEAALRADLSQGEILTSPNAQGVGKHILVIDDSELILENARRVLESDGYRVTTTSKTVGVAKYLVDCDLALIDYHMPGFNGAAVIESLRSAAAASGRTCLFYLYTSDPNVAKHYTKVGFDGVLTGKGDDAALLRGVRAAFRVLRLRNLRR
jgi:serine/threonine-protein kinase